LEDDDGPEIDMSSKKVDPAAQTLSFGQIKNLMVVKPFFVKVDGLNRNLSFERIQLIPQVMEGHCSISIDHLLPQVSE
jgi:hypothetical protein